MGVARVLRRIIQSGRDNNLFPWLNAIWNNMPDDSLRPQMKS